MFDKLNIKLLIISFIIGMIFSLLIGGISKVPFLALILRSVITGAVVLVCVYVISLLINNFLPELKSEGESESIIAEDEDESTLGQNIDIVMDDTPETESSETQFDHDAVKSANSPKSTESKETIKPNNDITNSNNEESADVIETAEAVEPASIDNAIRKGEAPMASTATELTPDSEFKAQSLPDIGALADNMGDLSVSSEEVEEEERVTSNRPRYASPLGNGDEMVDTVRKNDSEDMAKAIRTVIKREEG